MTKRETAKKAKPTETLSFEESLGRLEEIVSQLERGDAPLDSALKLYEEGVGLSRACARQLKEAERRVEILEDKNGELQGRPFGDDAGREAGELTGAEDEGAEAEGEEAEDDEGDEEAEDDEGDEEAEDEEAEDEDNDEKHTEVKSGDPAPGAGHRRRKSQDTLF